MLRVASNALIVPPFECAWLSLQDYQLDGACCLQFECKGENDVTIILKPFPGAKRWQHLQRHQGPAGGEHFAVEQNYTVILGSHRNSKLKIEKNGDEKASAAGLPGCTVNPQLFTSIWINYTPGTITVGTGPVGSSITYQWRDPDIAIPDIRHIGLSCWDKHVSYRNVQLLPHIPTQQLQDKQRALQELQLLQQQVLLQATPTPPPEDGADGPQQQQDTTAQDVSLIKGLQDKFSPFSKPQQQQEHGNQLQGGQYTPVPPLLQLVQDSLISTLTPVSVFNVLHLSELLFPRTQQLYDAAVQLAGSCFTLLVQEHREELAGLSVDVLADVLQEPLLDVPELAVFQAVAAWCQLGSDSATSQRAADAPESSTESTLQQQVQTVQHRYVDAACQDQQQQPQLQPQHNADGGDEGLAQQQTFHNRRQPAEAAAGCVLRPAGDVLDLLQLVRFGFMSDADRQAVLQHPFTQQCQLVQQCMQADIQRLRDSSVSPETGPYTFEQRRLVRPAGALGSGPAGDCPSNSSSSSSASKLAEQKRALSLDSSLQLPAAVRLPAAPPDVAQQTTPSVPCSNGQQAASVIAVPTISSTARGSGWRRCRRRLPQSCKELMYVCDGDRNGVIYHIATDYGTKQWVNPVLSKAIDIKASSPPSRYTDPKALVSGQFLNTSFAGPRYIRQPAPAAAQGNTASPAATASNPSTWWQLDLGPQHRLLCNYYTIRHDGSQDGFVRSWALQGSADLNHWLDLKRHVSDNTIRLPGQYGSWPVSGPAASMPFRAFRLLLLGPTQSHTNPWALCLSHWELYGYFYKLGDTQQQQRG